MNRLFTLFLLLTLSFPAFALTIETGTFEETFTITDYLDDYVDVPKGAVGWEVFGTTKELDIETKTDEGYDLIYKKPNFKPEVRSLDGTEVKVKGYMFPLDGAEKQKTFLFGPFPMTCPFQYHVGPSLVIEVHADNTPVTFSYDPVTLTGTLELVPNDPEYSIFYRLKNAVQTE